MYQLVCRGAKFSAFLFLFIAVPIVLETPTILKIWLKTVPEYTIVFVRLIVFSSFVDSLLGNSFWTAIMATGKIKGYQIVIAIVGVVMWFITVTLLFCIHNYLLYSIAGSFVFYESTIIYAIELFL